MAGKQPVRTVAGAALAAAGLVLAMLTGAPFTAALLALLAGAAALAIALWTRSETMVAATLDEDERPAPPAVADIVAAVEEPLLLVRERRVVLANPAARALLGAHIEGVDVRLAIRHPAAAERLGGPGSEGDLGPDRIELVGLGDADRHWEMAVAPLRDGSRLVRLTDQSQARATERMRADFVANASHELRTPLATLLGFLETLQDEQAAGDPDTRKRFLDIMFGEASRMRSLLDDLMSLSRIEADRFTAPRDPVDLLPLLRSVAGELKPLAEPNGSEILIEKEVEETKVAGDRAQLAQLFSNLVTNALKYGRPGTPVRIRVEEASSTLLRVRVIDQGEGIAAEHIPRLTERFYRIDAGRSRSVGGTGLGLAIAKHIALRHGGRLEIVSKRGEGTSVRVYLPRLEQAAA